MSGKVSRDVFLGSLLLSPSRMIRQEASFSRGIRGVSRKTSPLKVRGVRGVMEIMNRITLFTPLTLRGKFKHYLKGPFRSRP
jgi:hypothetical protein